MPITLNLEAVFTQQEFESFRQFSKPGESTEQTIERLLKERLARELEPVIQKNGNVIEFPEAQ